MSVNTRFIGQSIPRKEDRRLLSGAGRFVGDINIAGTLHVAFVRSTVAHAKILSIDVSQARNLAGVVDVITGQELRDVLEPVPGMQNRPPRQWRAAVEHEIQIPDQPILAYDVIRYVGEGLVVIVAEDRYIAEDAAELVEVDYEEIEPVVEVDAALKPTATRVHDDLPSNIVARLRVKKGNAEEVIASAPHRVSYSFYNHRYVALPMECRGVIAEYDSRLDTITVWTASQVVHWVRRELASRLSMPESSVRCIAPDVGGGFGVKGHVYPEDILIPYLARKLRRPVRWLEDRYEHLVNSAHARDDYHTVDVGFDDEGRILAFKDRFVKDSGAYTPVGVGAPSNSIAHIMGPYEIDHFDAEAKIVVTNKTPNAPYRGSGRPEAVFVMERTVDLIAHHLGIDPVEVRRRNMIRADQMPYSVGIPYRDGKPIVYDSGDYPAALEDALQALGGLESIRKSQAQALAEGRYIGLGVGCYVEGTGAGPFEGATVRVDRSGSIYVATGACAQGQGHETVFAQVAADEWGVSPKDVTVVIGDTGAISAGYGTIASRSAVNSSSAIRMASATLRKKVLELAAYLLEKEENDLELRDGRVFAKDGSNLSVSLKEVAAAAVPGWDNSRPAGMTAGLEVTEYFEPPTVTWAYATHAALVDVDPETYEPRILRYVVAHDSGTLLNPALAEGQVRGGVCQGVGAAFLEEIVYNDTGQPLTGSLMDYLIPTASDMPEVQILHSEIQSPLNELGIKGLGEGGAIPPPVVLANAVCDALKPFEFEVFSTPIRRSDIQNAISNRS